MALEDFFIKKFNLYNSKVYKLFKTEALVVSLPKILFELIIVILFSFMIILFLKMNYDSKEIITILSIFTLAAVKLLPSFNRILLSIQQINFGIPYLNVTYKEFKKYKLNLFENISQNMKFDKNITFKNLDFNYGDKKIFKKINININKGDVVYIKGPSGSGKTTFLDLFCGLIKPDKGNVLIDDKDIRSSLRDYQNLITYVPQSVYLLDESIKNNITLGENSENTDIKKLQKSLEIACLDNFIKSTKYGLDTLVGENGIKLSGGQKQRIGIARGFYKNSEIIILDEATNAIDLDTVEKIYKNIANYSKNKTILITSHHDYFKNFFNNKIDIGNIND
jgi:ATP-binding cassette subfamily C protein